MNKYFSFFVLLFFSCSDEKINWETETVERYNVSYKQDSLVVENLNYKDVKYFKNGRLQKKVIFSSSDDEKGTEVLNYKGGKVQSEYRSTDSTLLSKYDYNYENGFLLEKRAFDANNVLLRIEQYSYDDSGNQIEKIILDKNEIINRVYKFAFDNDGNELGFSVFNNEGKLILLETYEITQLDNQNRWVKKWAVRDSLIKAYYERTFKKNNKK